MDPRIGTTGDAAFWPRLVRALDESLGLEEKRRADPDQLLASVPPVAVSNAEVARVVQRCLDRRGTARSERGARRRRALLPLGAVALLAAATLVVWRWQCADSRRTLDYARTFDVLFDVTYPVEARLTAQRRIYVGMKNTLVALREIGQRDCPARGRAEQALAYARLLLDGEVHAAAPAAATGTAASLEACLDQLSRDAPSDRAVFEALRFFALGVLAMRNSPQDDPAFAISAATSLEKLGNVIEGKAPNTVDGK